MTTTAATGASRRQQRRQQYVDLSRGQLLDVAEEVFGRKGFHETTLKEVAELAEFSVGSVYSFFENKDDLFRQIFVRRGEQFVAEMRAALEIDATPTERLHRLVDSEIGFFRAHRPFARLFLRHSSVTMLTAGGQVDGVVASHYDEAMRLQATLFEQGQRAKELRKGDPQVLALLLSGLVSSYQVLDPMVVSDDPADGERLPLAEFHQLVENAFRV